MTTRRTEPALPMSKAELDELRQLSATWAPTGDTRRLIATLDAMTAKEVPQHEPPTPEQRWIVKHLRAEGPQSPRDTESACLPVMLDAEARVAINALLDSGHVRLDSDMKLSLVDSAYEAQLRDLRTSRDAILAAGVALCARIRAEGGHGLVVHELTDTLLRVLAKI